MRVFKWTILAVVFALRMGAAREATDMGGFARVFWYERTEPFNPHYEKRFRVNAPEAMLHPQFGLRVEARENGMMLIRAEEDLRAITRAELYLELWGGHPGTENKRVTINGRHTYHLPRVGSEDKHCTYSYPLLPLAHTDLVNGYDALQFACDQGSTFWGHYIVDNAAVRLWLSNSHPAVLSHQPGSLEPQVELRFTRAETFALALLVLPEYAATLSAVDFQAFYSGYDENGDGQERDWHGFTKARQPAAWIGTATNTPFAVPWDVSMIPDQEDVQIRALLHFRDDDSLIYVTRPLLHVRTPKRSARVSLHRAEDLPRPFWSRAGQKKSCIIDIDVAPERIENAELHVVAWAGGSGTISNYFTLNGHPFPVAEGSAHDVQYSRLPLSPSFLKKGKNRIELLSDTEHHGIELFRPGPAIVVRERK